MRRGNVGLLRGVLVVAVILMCAACATFGLKPYGEMTAKEKSSYFMSTYNRQYEATMRLATRGNLTETEKQIVRTRKAVLVKLHPAILAYDEMIVNGQMPTALAEQKILELIDRLTLMAIGG